MLIELLVGVTIVLIIVCLVVRDRTEYRLTRLRSQVMNLRAQEQRLVDKYKETEQVATQTNEAFVRAGQHQKSCKQGNKMLQSYLEKLYPLITNTPFDPEANHSDLDPPVESEAG